MKNVYWGIIGCGNVTEVKSAPAFNRVPNSKLVAVMRRNGDRARDYAERHSVPRWYDNADLLINDDEVNAVYIATPPDSHLYYTKLAAAAGKPVYVEKPMARNHTECLEMIEACEKAGVPLFVAYYRRRLPMFMKVKELIESGAIGKPVRVKITLLHPPHPGDRDKDNLPWRVIPEISGGGHFVDLASHQFDYLDYLFGQITEATGVAENTLGLYPAEDKVTAYFRFGNNVTGEGIWDFTVDKNDYTDKIEISGEAGKLSFSTFDVEPLTLSTSSGEESFSLPPDKNIQLPLIISIIEELTADGICPSTGISAARTNRVIDQILHG